MVMVKCVGEAPGVPAPHVALQDLEENGPNTVAQF